MFLDPARIASVEALADYLVGYFCDGEVQLTEEQVGIIEEMASGFEQFC